jgi:hypothetical protein
VRSLVEDIRDVRFHKVETNLETLNERALALKVCFFMSLCESIDAAYDKVALVAL